MNAKDPIIGIDLGSSRSIVAAMLGSRPEILSGGGSAVSIPSVVAFEKGGPVLVGDGAVRLRALDPARSVCGAKRFLGRCFSDLSAFERSYRYPICRVDDDSVAFAIEGQLIRPEEVLAHVLKQLATRARADLGRAVGRAVITIPACFGHRERRAVMRAAEIAGLQVERLLLESTAAAIASFFDRSIGGTFAIVDVGGGTCNVAIVEVGDGVIEVLGTAGDAKAGGDDFTEALAQHVVLEFCHRHDVDLQLDASAIQRVWNACETAKVGLSHLDTVMVSVPAIMRRASEWVNFCVSVERVEYEILAGDLLRRIGLACDRAVDAAGLRRGRLNGYLLMGGSSRIPWVGDIVRAQLGCDRLPKRANPDEVVALGAAIQAGVLQGDVRSLVVLDLLPFGIGVLGPGGEVIEVFAPGTCLPTSVIREFMAASSDQSAAVFVLVQINGSGNLECQVLASFEIPQARLGGFGTTAIRLEVSVDGGGNWSVLVIDAGSGRRFAFTGLDHPDLSLAGAAEAVRSARESPVRLVDPEA
jgi:molecular chaperone DnaK